MCSHLEKGKMRARAWLTKREKKAAFKGSSRLRKWRRRRRKRFAQSKAPNERLRYFFYRSALHFQELRAVVPLTHSLTHSIHHIHCSVLYHCWVVRLVAAYCYWSTLIDQNFHFDLGVSVAVLIFYILLFIRVSVSRKKFKKQSVRKTKSFIHSFVAESTNWMGGENGMNRTPDQPGILPPSLLSIQRAKKYAVKENCWRRKLAYSSSQFRPEELHLRYVAIRSCAAAVWTWHGTRGRRRRLP